MMTDMSKFAFPASWFLDEQSRREDGFFFDNPTPDWRLLDCRVISPMSAEVQQLIMRILAKDRHYENLPDYDLPWQVYEYRPAHLGWRRHFHRPELSEPAWFPTGWLCAGEVIGEDNAASD